MPRVEINYVCENQTAVEAYHESRVSDDLAFTLVGKAEFVKAFQTYYPHSQTDAATLWHNIMGNYPGDLKGGAHPDVRYLTNYSCEIILKHYHLFTNGVDYQNLPAGFFLAKNPSSAGVRDVLHYSDYVAKNQARVSAFAVTVADKGPLSKLDTVKSFSGYQAIWYKFLLSKASTAQHQLCTQKELDDAFINFSNLVGGLGLAFFTPDFTKLSDDVNPIVLIARWSSVVRNQHLKPQNLTSQWETILSLPLSKGYGAIRAITDNQRSKNPCGFILPEMGLGDVVNKGGHWSPDEYTGVKTVVNYKDIRDEQGFWRYLAFQPQCNSIAFYQDALKCIKKMDIRDGQVSLLLRMLAGSTTGVNHRGQQNSEQDELKIWQDVCDLTDGIESLNLATRTIAAGNAGHLKSEFLKHLTRLTKQPNLVFLRSIAQHISAYVGSLNAIVAAGQVALGIDPLAGLVELSDKLNRVISRYETDVYLGARFYFTDAKWTTLDIKRYIELQDSLAHFGADDASLLVPHISTFNIQTAQELGDIAGLVQRNTSILQLAFCLTIFKDVNVQLNKDALTKIITAINEKQFNDNDYNGMLDFISNSHSKAFPDGYFERKKQQLLDATHGLSPQQIELLSKYNFPDTQHSYIVQIESAVVRKDGVIDDQNLVKLNDRFLVLNEILMPDESELFLKRMADIREEISGNEQLGVLLDCVLAQKSLLTFNTIFLRNKITPCGDGLLLKKIQAYMETADYISSKIWTVDPIKLQETMATLFLKSTGGDMAQGQYQAAIGTIIDAIHATIKVHPHAQDYIFAAVNQIVQNDSGQYLPEVKKLVDLLNHLVALYPAGADKVHAENMTVFYSLMSHFNNSTDKLMTLAENIGKCQHAEMEAFFYTLVSRLLDSNHPIDGIEELVKLCSTDQQNYKLLQAFCAKPPYPGIKSSIQWLKDGTFAKNYQEYSLKPFSERRLEYTFSRKHYDKQRTEFKGISDKLFSDEVADELQRLLTANRTKSMKTLQDELEVFRGKDDISSEQAQTLLCLCIEFLARTTHQQDAKSATGMGSQELNTTQVMTLHAMLMQDNPKVLNQIDTGEGKSRITMVLAGFKALQGKTVDFVTSDMQLAERDFFVYKQFFTSLGVSTGLISLKTPKQLYQQGGVNFSDNAQLLLLRNRSDIELSRYDYLDVDEGNRCLLIDEVDHFKHDKSKDAYNYANRSRRLTGYIWVYPLLVKFMEAELKSIMSHDEKLDFAKLVDKFIGFVSLHDTNLMHQASLAEMQKNQPAQLQLWLKSAHTALHMEDRKDYVVTDAADDKLFSVRDHEGFTRYTRKVMVLNNGRPMEGSAFSDGVHQCLCAIENKKIGHETFVILAENETQRSSYTTSFIDQYKSVYGVSGTTRFEAPLANPLINIDKYQYVITPREKKLIREDKNVRHAKDETQQIAFIKHEILTAMKQGKSFLLICKNDQQSARLHDALKADTSLQKAVAAWQRVHSLTTSKDEQDAIKKAGIANYVTISTVGMFARGVDINAEHKVVMSAFVPTFEDEIQIKGRSGRFGRPGDYRMIPNLADKECTLDGQTYNIANSVDKVQKELAISAILQEQVSAVYSQFLEDVHQCFLKEYQNTPKLEQLDMLGHWQDFLGAMQKDWEIRRPELINLVQKEDDKKFLEFFNAFANKWSEKVPVKGGAIDLFNEGKAVAVYNSLIAQKGFFKPERKKLKVQAGYDVADDGQARIYSGLFVQTRAVLSGERPMFADFTAWQEGRGELFPDFMATLRGERPLFANLRATIAYLIQALMDWINGPKIEPPAVKEPVVGDALAPAY